MLHMAPTLDRVKQWVLHALAFVHHHLAASRVTCSKGSGPDHMSDCSQAQVQLAGRKRLLQFYRIDSTIMVQINALKPLHKQAF